MSEKLPDNRGAFLMRTCSDSTRRRPIAIYGVAYPPVPLREATGSILRRESAVCAGLMVDFVFPYGTCVGADIRVSLSPRHGASSGCGRRNGLQYGG